MNAVEILATLGTWGAISTAVLACAWLATFFARKTASLRHLIWVTGFIVLLLIPAISFVLPTRFTFPSSKPEVVTFAPDVLVETNELTFAPTPQEKEFDWALISTGALAIWAIGLGIMATLIIRGFLQARVIRKQSALVSPDSLGIAALHHRAGVSRNWELRVSMTRRPPAAMTWGWWTPIVILPKDSEEWDAEKVEAVLMHELAHVRRFDSLTQFLSISLCAVYWFNPFIWMAAKALRNDAEIAADDRVILSGIKPSVYAIKLLSLASELGQRRNPLSTIGVSIMKQSKIETRILSIVDPTNRRRGIARIQGISVVALGIVAVFVGAALSPSLALAQDKAKDTKPPVEVPIKVQTVERVQGVEVKEVPVQGVTLIEVRADQVRQGKAAKQGRKKAARKAARTERVRGFTHIQLLDEKAKADKAHRVGYEVRAVEAQRAHNDRVHESRVGAELRFRSEDVVHVRLVEGKAVPAEQVRKAEVDGFRATQVREGVKVQGHLTKVEDVPVHGRKAGEDHVNGRLGTVTFEAKTINLQAAPKAKAEVALQLRSENVRFTTEVKPETRHELVLRAVPSDRGELVVRSVPIKLETSKKAAIRKSPARNVKVKSMARVDEKVQQSAAKKKAIDDEKAAADKARRKQQELDDLEINRQKYNL